MPNPSLENEIHIHKGSEQVTIVFDKTKPSQFYRGVMLASAIPEAEELHEFPDFRFIGASIDDSRSSPTGGGGYLPETLSDLGTDLSMLGYTDMMFYEENPLSTNLQLDRCALPNIAVELVDNLGLQLSLGMQTFTHANAILSDPRYQHFGVNTNTFDHQNPQTQHFFEDVLVPDAVNLLGKGGFINIGADEMVKVGEMDLQAFANDFVRVAKLFKEYGVTIMLWTDDLIKLPREKIEQIAEQIEPILGYWEYESEDSEYIEEQIGRLSQFGLPIFSFSGLQDWNRFDTFYEKAERNIRAHAIAARNAGVAGFFTSSWGDGSDKKPMSGNQLGFVLHAEHAYNDAVDPGKIERILSFLTGEHADEFREAGKMDRVTLRGNSKEFPPNIAQVLLFEDPLTHPFSGSVTCSFSHKYEEHYQKLLGMAESSRNVLTKKRQIALADVLRIKADLGMNARKAYQNNDRDSLQQAVTSTNCTMIRVVRLKNTHEAEWFNEKHPAGFEKIAERYDILMQQLVFMRDQRLIPFLEGTLEGIPEFNYAIAKENAKFMDYLLWYGDILSASTRKNPLGSA